MTERLGLFPLGMTLLPGQLLPVHVFEPRYRDLLRDLVQGAFDPGTGRAARRRPRFGVIAIRVGSEVGAHTLPDLHRIGCVAEVLEVEQHRDGTSDLMAVGRERFELLGLDPSAGTSYLTGRVRWLEEPPGSAAPELSRDVRELFDRYRRIVTVSAADRWIDDDESEEGPAGARGADGDGALEPEPEAGADDAATTRLPNDPTVLSWAVAGSMVLHAGERQQLLEDADAGARLRRLRRLLRRELALLPLLPSLPATELARQPPDPR